MQQPEYFISLHCKITKKCIVCYYTYDVPLKGDYVLLKKITDKEDFKDHVFEVVYRVLTPQHNSKLCEYELFGYLINNKNDKKTITNDEE